MRRKCRRVQHKNVTGRRRSSSSASCPASAAGARKPSGDQRGRTRANRLAAESTIARCSGWTGRRGFGRAPPDRPAARASRRGGYAAPWRREVDGRDRRRYGSGDLAVGPYMPGSGTRRVVGTRPPRPTSLRRRPAPCGGGVRTRCTPFPASDRQGHLRQLRLSRDNLGIKKRPPRRRRGSVVDELIADYVDGYVEAFAKRAAVQRVRLDRPPR